MYRNGLVHLNTHTGNPGLYLFFHRVLSFSIMEDVMKKNNPVLSVKVLRLVVECALLYLILNRRP